MFGGAADYTGLVTYKRQPPVHLLFRLNTADPAVGVTLLDIYPSYLWDNMLKYTGVEDLTIGLIKAVVFGGIVAIIGCYKGMNCGEGAEGVGRATTEAVVYSSITILISNFFLTLALSRLFHPV